MVQWLRIRLPMQGTWIGSLVQIHPAGLAPFFRHPHPSEAASSPPTPSRAWVPLPRPRWRAQPSTLRHPGPGAEAHSGHTRLCFLFAPNNTTDGICQEPSRLSATQTLDVSPSLTGSMWWGSRMGGHQREDGTVGHHKREPRGCKGCSCHFRGTGHGIAGHCKDPMGPNQGGPEPHHPEPYVSSHKP